MAYCNRCGADDHFANRCPGVSPDDERRKKERERKARWREKNRDRYNDYQREYMRGRR